jgi:cytochrome b6-f complex iron-sulfur subunit
MNTRRQFIAKIALWSSLSSALLAFLGSFTMLIPRIRYNRKKIKINQASAYPIGKYSFIPEAKVFIYRERKGIKVVSAICTHLGCTLTHFENEFRCPCHGSCYDHRGHVLAGPAQANLTWYEISQNWDGTLNVHKDKKVDDQYIFSKL